MNLLHMVVFTLLLTSCTSSHHIKQVEEKQNTEKSCVTPNIRSGFELYAASLQKIPRSRSMEVLGKVIYYSGEPIVTSNDFASVTEASDTSPMGRNGYAYIVQLNQEASQRLAEATKKLIGKYILIIDNGAGIAIPLVNSVISDGRFVYVAPLTEGDTRISEFERFCKNIHTTTK